MRPIVVNRREYHALPRWAQEFVRAMGGGVVLWLQYIPVDYSKNWTDFSFEFADED